MHSLHALRLEIESTSLPATYHRQSEKEINSIKEAVTILKALDIPRPKKVDPECWTFEQLMGFHK